MGLVRVGFFRELRHGRADAPSLRESLRGSAQSDEEAIVRYLNSCATLATTGSLVDDYLDTTKKGIAALEIVTDGTWVWPRDLAYYVRQYHVELPTEFLEHMRLRQWKPAKFTQDEMMSLETEYRIS